MNLLVLGDPQEISRVVPLLDSNDHSLYAALFSDEPDAAFDLDGVTVINDLDAGPDAFDALCVIDLRGNGAIPWIMELLDSEERLADVPLLVVSPFVTATAIATELAASRPLGVTSLVPGATRADGQIEFSLPLQGTPQENEGVKEIARTLLGDGAVETEDRVGHIAVRILAMIVNEAVFALQEGVANAGDIDTAMRYGTNYPKGPLAWCDEVGAEIFVQVLDLLQSEYGEERYRPAIMLRQYARAGKLFHETSD